MDRTALPPSVLMATTNERLLDDLLRLAAAASITPLVERDLHALRRSWHACPLVIVGDDLVAGLARTTPVRRTGVVLAGAGPGTDELYRHAFEVGADAVFRLPADEAALSGRLVDTLDGGVRSAVTLAFVGGCGGAGATTMAAAVALSGNRRGLRTMLIDGDPLGGGIELALGIERDPGQRWPELLNAAGRVSAAALRSVLPTASGLPVLSWDRSDVTALPPETMRSVLNAAQCSNDLVVLDLPRRPDPAVEEAFVRATATLLVVPCDIRSLAAAKRLAGPLAEVAGDLRVIARETRRPAVPAVEAALHLGLPLATSFADERDLSAAMDQGRFDPNPRGSLARAAGMLLDLFAPVA
ncbi:septum site-determining protein Ssd [Kribbella sp. NPDC056345]|uniref:septum site-determining protein Ssd n=1 Tax=Kribbella sp. NPDC056345 TaxID=3345789 RepID=UPI0035E19BE5